MTKQIIEKELHKLIVQDDSGIAALYAPWGNGKTHFWKDFIQKLSKDESREVPRDLRYSYISLFGMKSLKDIRNKIFENTVPLSKVKDDNPVQGYMENVAQSLSCIDHKTLKLLSKVRFSLRVPYVHFSHEFSSAISDLSVRNMLICVDDFERKSKDISTGEILGCLNYLKEECNCTIVIIFNQEKLLEDEKIEFDKFNEKVIDINLSFDLSTNDLLDLLDHKNHPVYRHVCKYIKKIGSKNLRIISKIHALSIKLSSILQGFDEEVIEVFVKSACLFCYCNLTQDENVPDTDFLINIITYYSQDARDKLGEKYPFYMSFVEDYDYRIAQEYDKLILEGVEKGFFDDEKLLEQAKIVSDQIKSDFKRNEIAEIWSLIRGSFDNNASEITDTLISKYKANIAYATVYDVDAASELLEVLKETDLARDMIDYYIEHLEENNKIINLNKLHLGINNKSLTEAINNMTRKEQNLELKQVIEDRIIKQTWDDSDLEFLGNVDEAEYIKYFKSLKGESLFATIKELFKFDRLTPQNDLYAKITNQVKNSLLDIAKESDINKFRIHTMLGVNEEK